MSDPVVTFRQVIERAIGGGWGKDEPASGLVEVRVIRGTDFARIADLNFQDVPCRYEAVTKVPQRTLVEGDVVLEISGGSRAAGQATGRTILITQRLLDSLPPLVIPASFCRLLRFDRSKIVPRYGYYALQDMYTSDRVSLYEQQSTGISNFQFEYFLDTERVRLPGAREQDAIASALGSLDDKILQNKRTAKKLEQLAKAIFRAWFVNFDPVKARVSGATAFPSMPQSVFDTLPNRFEASNIGKVPKGWTVKSITHIASFLNGLALQKYPPRGDGEDLRVIKIAQLRKGSTEVADLANSDVPEQFVVDDGDLLFSWSGTLEARFWFGGKGALNQHLFKVTSSQFPAWFCYQWVRHHLPEFRAIAASKATTMGHIQRRHLQEAKVVVPPDNVLQAASAQIGLLHDLQAQLTLESRKLAEMRDYLLPKLLSGELRVPIDTGDGNAD